MASPPPPAKPRRYVPALGPRMKVLLFVVFAATGLLGATGAYLGAISFLDWLRKPLLYTNTFTFWALIAHVAVGLVMLLPFAAFGLIHLVTSWKRTNKMAIRLGVVLLIASAGVVLSGLALIQFEGLPQLPTGTVSRGVAHALHIGLPLACIVLYVMHRRAGPKIRWKWGYAWIGATVACTVAAIALHGVDPRYLSAEGPKEGVRYFFPSEARTASGNFIPASVLMMDEYCKKCHADIYNDHFHSAHRFSSFNNPPYLFSVRETRKVSLERDGNVRASRWCAGCHDPVPFFSGAFDDPKFDDVSHPTAHAGITCTACHAITKLHADHIGNAAYTIEEPPHYPFAQSDNAFLQWINNQLVKARPELHKQTFLKPDVHRSPEFCSTCHKVSLPFALNHYKDFLRGQNHYDSFLLSGVSGHGARSFYYPEKAKTNCADCHMPLKPSNDFGARATFDDSGVRKVHDHMFPGGNTGLFSLLTREPRYQDHADEFRKAVDVESEFLRDKKMRIDLFGLKDGASTDPKALLAPLRPQLPALKPGQKYLVEVVIRTVNVGHPFTQGTVDSNEVWVDFQAKADGREIARSGGLVDEANEAGPVDEWSHFVNVLMLDRDGNRINRRNPQDIFTPLYDHQIPPGAAQVVHYRLDVPADAKGTVELRVRLRYRKFDYEYMKLVHNGKEPLRLPIVDLCEDRVTLPVEGSPAPTAGEPPAPEWQRWNDYGIANLIEGGQGLKRGHFRQAEAAFRQLLKLEAPQAPAHAHLNLARVYIDEGRFPDAARELEAAGKAGAPWWSLTWFTALVNSENINTPEHLDTVIDDLERLVDEDHQPEKETRRFDFSKDYVVINRLANLLFKRSQFEADDSPEKRAFLLRSARAAERVLDIDAEDVEAHDLLARCYARLSAGAEPVAADLKTTPDPAALTAGLRDAKRPPEQRIAAVAELRALTLLDAKAFAQVLPGEARLPVLRDAVRPVQEAFHAEQDAAVQSALARLLEALHRELHAIYKPDEIARARSTAIYRKSHPAANYAARDRVIYPTTAAHRESILKTGNLSD